MSVVVPSLTVDGETLILRQEQEPAWRWNFSELRLASTRPRLVLLGESVAAGYFYRPELTFADLLRDAFPQFEVVDLSRIDLPFEELRDFRALVTELRPSRVIVFAGNNHLPSEVDVARTLDWLLAIAAEIQLVLPSFNPAWKSLQQIPDLESQSPRITAMMERSLRNWVAEHRVALVETADLDLMDYCHFSQAALREITRRLGGPQSPAETATFMEVRAHERAFFHCLGYGQFDLCLLHLQRLTVLDPQRAEEFRDATYQAIFEPASPLFRESFFRFVAYPGLAALESKLFFFYTPPALEAALRPSANMPLPSHEHIDLLVDYRCLQSRRHLVHHRHTDPYLVRRTYNPFFQTYFFRAELPERFHVKAELSFLPGDTHYEVQLNGVTIQRLDCSVPTCTLGLPDQQLRHYNELAVQVFGQGSDDATVRRHGRFQLLRLELGRVH